MTRFCGNCGAPLDDDARVCGQCGTPIGGGKGFKVVNPAKKKRIIKKIKLLITLLIIAALAFGGVKVALNFTGANGLVRKTMTAYGKYDINTLVSISSDMYYYCEDENYVDGYFENSVGYNIDSIETSVGHNYKLTYEIEEIYELSQRKFEEMKKDINEWVPDFDTNVISKIKIARLKVTAKQDDKSVSKDVTITMTKEGKEWKLLYLD